MMSKETMSSLILDAKSTKGTTWELLSELTKLDPVCIAAACLGNATLSKEEADIVTETLELNEEVRDALMVFPTKGPGQVIPSDPLIYRFYEIAYVYGTSIKEVVHEKFGDGIMSAIDFTLNVDKIEDPKGDRVQVTMTGKFLPYKKW
ncbi:cyanase [Wenyingzhuangia sp. IMCC45574]